jgi:formate dehydrogenase iron-sulfur subunit
VSVLDSYGPEAKERVGFFTDTSVCIGCKACEVACKEWNLVPEDGMVWTGESYDNTSELGANSWRHVAFVEQAEPLRWLMSSDVCKHCTHAACLDVCPTGALFRTEYGTVVVQEDICNGCGYCVPACPFGVIDKRHLPREDPPVLPLLTKQEDGRVWKCTLCYDRLKGGHEPACAKACPTDSIQFGPLDELRERAGQPSRSCRRRIGTARGSMAMTPRTASAASARSSCCSTSPRSTGCRRTRS